MSIDRRKEHLQARMRGLEKDIRVCEFEINEEERSLLATTNKKDKDLFEYRASCMSFRLDSIKYDLSMVIQELAQLE